MNYLFLDKYDECDKNLYYAQETMKAWIPLTDYEMIFEASDTATSEKISQNALTGKKSVGFIRQAINAVISVITKLVDSISDFIARITMGDDERNRLKEFERKLAEDPKLKNKKVSVKDFRKINARYDELLNKVESEIRAVKADENHSINDTVREVAEFTKNTVNAATTIVAADTALKMADSNIEMAKKLSAMLNNDKAIMANLSKQLGEKDATKFKKEIDAASKNTFLHKVKVKLFRHKYDSLKECIEGTMNAFTDIGWDTATMARRALNNEYTGKVIKATGKTIISGEKELAKKKVDEKVNKIKNSVQSKFTPKPKPPKTAGVHKPIGDFIRGK